MWHFKAGTGQIKTFTNIISFSQGFYYITSTVYFNELILYQDQVIHTSGMDWNNAISKSNSDYIYIN